MDEGPDRGRGELAVIQPKSILYGVKIIPIDGAARTGAVDYIGWLWFEDDADGSSTAGSRPGST
jgi:hypothetical protein